MSLARIKQHMAYLHMQHTLDILGELAESAVKEQTSHLAFLDRVLTLEVENREERRIATSLKLSGLPRGMRLDNFDFMFQPSVEKERIDFLATGEFIRQKENVLLFGPPGVGKTHLATGLGVRAVELGYSVACFTLEELLHKMKRRSDTPVIKQRRQAYLRNALVIVDELGYQVLDRQEVHLFFQFVSARYRKGSTIITSNRSVKDWVHVFAGDQMATTAILDRLFHRAHLFNIDGKSYRLRDFEKQLEGRNLE
jgi:DNA replication protein DnaC